jgi:hypothetical protein
MKRQRSSDGRGRHDGKRRHRERPSPSQDDGSVDSDGEPIDDEAGHLEVRAGDLLGDRCERRRAA